jgi:hypothetical protein
VFLRTPLPSGDAIDETRIWVALEVLVQPGEVDAPWVIAALRLVLDVASLAMSPQETTDGRLADTKQRGRLLVRPALLGLVGLDDAPAKIEGEICHSYVRSLIGRAWQLFDRLNEEAA